MFLWVDNDVCCVLMIGFLGNFGSFGREFCKKIFCVRFSCEWILILDFIHH